MVYMPLFPICKTVLLMQTLCHSFFISVKPLNEVQGMKCTNMGCIASLTRGFGVLGRAVPSLSKKCSNSATEHPNAVEFYLK